ncbi:MAG: response regulator [Clostridia bacterium]|nr:response regulator [Deltaproteobacteria bacterium]
MTVNAQRVLLVEDEPQMRKFLRAALVAQGFEIIEAENAAEANIRATTEPPDIMLLDLGLPDMDGIDLVKRFREWTRMPIIVLSARGRETDKVAALDAGADDYVTKPFSVGELLARMRVALRHANAGTTTPEQVLTAFDLSIDLTRREVKLRGVEVKLTPLEYRLLVLLARNAGKVLTHKQLLTEVWGAAYASQTHYLRVYTAQLRRKIEDDPARPKILITEPGVGYRFRDS